MYGFMQTRILRGIIKEHTLQRRYLGSSSSVWQVSGESYHFCPGQVPLSGNTVSRVLDEAVDMSGDHTVFVSSQQGIAKTYSQFRREVDRLASGLLSVGLRKGDRIGLCTPNCYEWPLTQFATAKAGLILVNLNPALQPNELEYCLKKVSCKAVIVWDTIKTQNFYEILCKIIPELSTSTSDKIKNSKLPNLERIIMISERKERGVLSFKDVVQSGNAESDQILGTIEKNIQFDDPVNIQFTSGTTGMPKGAVLSHFNVVNNALFAGRRFGFNSEKPNICCQVPLFHCFGCVLASLATVTFQGTCVFPQALFDPVASLKAAEQNKCTVMYGTPTMYVDLLNKFKLQKYNTSSLKHAVFGGSVIPTMLAKDIQETFQLHHISNAYGSTENSPAVAMNGMEDGLETAFDMKIRALEYIEIKLIDVERRVVPTHSQGEVCVRGHNVFLEYWQDTTRTADVLDNAGWYYTGDFGTMDEKGFVKIIGRKKDMIIRGGENIYPTEVENFLSSHPDITEAHVVGVPDPRMGEEVCAWITFRQGSNLTPDQVKDFCKGQISHFKIPRYILVVEEFPKTASGKIKKFEMQRITIEKLSL